MSDFFPLHTTTMRIEEPKAFRRFSLSLWEMALITGVLVRVYRSLVLTHGTNNFGYIAATMTLALVFIIFMATAHLANYPLHQYLWRAPLFTLVEVAAEMGASALLIAVGREPHGSVRAHWDDWLGMGLNALLTRGLAIVLWGLVLALIVQLVRRTIVHEDEDDELEVAHSA